MTTTNPIVLAADRKCPCSVSPSVSLQSLQRKPHFLSMSNVVRAHRASTPARHHHHHHLHKQQQQQQQHQQPHGKSPSAVSSASPSTPSRSSSKQNPPPPLSPRPRGPFTSAMSVPPPSAAAAATGAETGGRATAFPLQSSKTQSSAMAATAASAAASASDKATKKPSVSSCGVSREEMEEYQAAFRFFDENQDGFITEGELLQAMNRCGQFPTKPELKLIMSQGDNDRNGVITFDEFAALMDGRAGRNRYSYMELRDQFDLFDKDKDGYIERAEMHEIVQELNLAQRFPPDVIDALFRDADADGDGRISFEEFVLSVN